MSKPVRTYKDWRQAKAGICGCGRDAMILEGQCPECHDADHASEVETYYLNRIEALKRQNAALVELLKELQPIAFITRHNELHKAIDDAITPKESTEGEENE